LVARSSGYAIVWSPPMASRWPASARSSGGGLDLADRLGDVERVAGDVARVGDLLLGQRPDLEGGVPGAEQP